MNSEMAEERSEIAFFDVETTAPSQSVLGVAILEFGAIIVCRRKLEVLGEYSTLIRPADPSRISSLSDRSNGITKAAIVSAPSFADVAHVVYDLLHGRIWAGHNILEFDSVLIREAFAEINRPAPEPKGTIDSLPLLRQSFGRRAGDMKMATLAAYFGLGEQNHRSLDDVKMNLEVLKYSATVLFLESSLPDIFSEESFLEPDGVSIPSISVTLTLFSRGMQKIEILHENSPLQLRCACLEVRFGISTKFKDHVGRPRLSFVVDATPNLCEVLDKADELAEELWSDSGSSSEWHHVVTRKPGFFNSPTVRLHLPWEPDGEINRWTTEIYLKDNSSTQKVMFSRFDIDELSSLVTEGSVVDAYFSLEPYDFPQHSGIKLEAKKLVFHSW